jgi:hypothetical protein
MKNSSRVVGDSPATKKKFHGYIFEGLLLIRFSASRILLPGQTESKTDNKNDHVVFNRNECFFSEERLRGRERLEARS